MTPENELKQRFSIAKIVITTGWILTLVTAVVILLSAVFMVVTNQPVPEVIQNWGGMILGFLFGNLFGLIKDFSEVKNNGST